MSDEIGQQIGDYEILNELGAGGMGKVYRVRNVISDRIEAMKIVLPNLAGQQDLAARFLREIKVMARLEHPNIAALRTAFTANNQLVMIMEYVEGTTLADQLEHGAIPVPAALNYMDQVLNALSYAHALGIIHRDIKPANMMLTPQGVIKLMDFGIARVGDDRGLTVTGATLGSLSYMSPEQVKGEPTDARSDLYSVGVSLYEIVTGQRPFQANSDYAIMTAHITEIPRPPIELYPGLPSTLNEIILMAIAKDPAMRFKNAEAFRNALRVVAGSLPAMPAMPVNAPQMPTAAPAGAPLPGAPAPGAPPRGTVRMPVAETPRTPTMVMPPPSASAPRTPTMVMPPVSQPAQQPAAGAVPMAPPPPASSSGHRGLYMTLGALIVLVVLAGAGVYIPRWSKTHAEKPAATSVPSATDTGTQTGTLPSGTTPATTPNPAPAATPSATVPGGAAAGYSSGPPEISPRRMQDSAGSQPISPATGKRVDKLVQKLSEAVGETEPAQGEGTPATQQPSAADKAQLDELETQVDKLSNRAAAVNSSLDRMQQQQAASGYGLRGDMVAHQASMKNNLAKAQDAVQRGDVERAKKFSKLAESDVEALEQFLGR